MTQNEKQLVADAHLIATELRLKRKVITEEEYIKLVGKLEKIIKELMEK